MFLSTYRDQLASILSIVDVPEGIYLNDKNQAFCAPIQGLAILEQIPQTVVASRPILCYILIDAINIEFYETFQFLIYSYVCTLHPKSIYLQ